MSLDHIRQQAQTIIELSYKKNEQEKILTLIDKMRKALKQEKK